jgi:cysteine-rich repeat protein
VQQGEQCDDANSDNTDGCTDNEANGGSCQTAFCGDGFVFAGVEDCDEGTAANSATCDSDCTTVECGDGLINTENGEVCDDQGESFDCNINCTPASCGDQIVNTTRGEECDDGNNVDNDGCNNNCETPDCGNGVIEVGEDCDDGANNSDTASDACRRDCTNPFCGDGIVDSNEDCDDANDVDNDNCTNTCAAPRCGDGIQNGTEECDLGDGNNSDTLPDACREDCTNPTCGDLVADTGEDCDDGNESDLDSCLSTCLDARCGDGILRTDLNPGDLGYEECDDGNSHIGDACAPAGAGNECQVLTAIGWRTVPAGSFRLGSLINNTSAPLITLPEFEMSRSEVTVAQYRECVNHDPDNNGGACQVPNTISGCTWSAVGNDTLPVNCISYQNALDYASYVNDQMPGFTVALPSETQWEYAARSLGQAHEFSGNVTAPTCQDLTSNITSSDEDCVNTTVRAVCSNSTDLSDPDHNGDTDQQICDLSGSVSEFVLDSYTRNYSNTPTNGDPFILPGRTFYNVLRGGHWLLTTQNSFLRTIQRDKIFFISRINKNGIRLVRKAN